MSDQYVRLKIPRAALLKIKETWDPSEPPEKLIQEMIDRHLRLEAENSELRSAQDKGSKLVVSLRDNLDRSGSEIESLRKANRGFIEQVAALKVEYHLMERKVEYLEAHPAVQEKVVYRENTETIAALKKKKDELQHSVWEKEELLRRAQNESNEMKESMSKLKKEAEDRTRKHFALLLTRKGGAPAPAEWDIEARLIDSSEYYIWKGDEGQFRRLKNIKGNYMILPIEEIRQ